MRVSIMFSVVIADDFFNEFERKEVSSAEFRHTETRSDVEVLHFVISLVHNDWSEYWLF